jgi:hypothetical protein
MMLTVYQADCRQENIATVQHNSCQKISTQLHVRDEESLTSGQSVLP